MRNVIAAILALLISLLLALAAAGHSGSMLTIPTPAPTDIWEIATSVACVKPVASFHRLLHLTEHRMVLQYFQ